MIDLDEKYIKFIKDTINSYLQNYKIYIFGSRAKNKAKKYSDIDIALDSTELTKEIKTKIIFDIENSTFPYEIDIVDLNAVSREFKSLIENDLIEL